MRLRLSVQRHKLPATNILWNVPDNASPQAYTIARLLEDVNAILPLDAENWGLEDYIVELDGFECLHFSPVAQCLKDDDTVSIRPLLTAEVRARTLSGRYQINEGGQHLVDGIPFGRPLLRTPNRPQVHIPPRKRQRLSEEAEEQGTAAAPFLITEKEEVSPAAHEQVSTQTVSDNVRPGDRTQGQKRKRVTFEQQPAPEIDDSDGEDDEDFVLEDGWEDVDSDASSKEAGGHVQDSDSSSTDTESSSDDSSDTDDSSTDSSDSDSEDDVSSASEPEHLPSTQKPKPADPPAVPHRGATETRRRNKRRQLSKKLHKLKASGALPRNATLEDVRKLLETDDAHSEADDETSAAQQDTAYSKQGSRKRKYGAEEVIFSDNATIGSEPAELEQREEELAESIALEPFAEHPSAKETPAEEPPATPDSARKRLRPDVSAIGRIISRQARQVDKKVSKAKETRAAEAQVPPDPDFWKSKINLSAFECWEEDFELSAPPFPFEQHWDPASKLMHEKANKKRQKNSKRKEASETSAAVDDNEESIVLDYGDGGDKQMVDNGTSAAIESQLLQDVATAAKIDLPDLPQDIGSLPALEPLNIQKGAVIAFKLFELNPKTMNPEISAFKTAIVEKEGDSGNGAGEIELRLAARDRFHREKKFDKHGNRIVETADKFQVEASDEEEDDGVIFHRFADLMEAKLLKAA